VRGFQPLPRRRQRPVTTSNFEDWCADPRNLTFEEYMTETVVDESLPPLPRFIPAPPPLRSVR
jgi:hypothetical protein